MRTPASFHFPLLLLASLSISLLGLSQEAGSEEQSRLEYQLILPDEKTPESVKPNERTPFSKASSLVEDDSSSEENQLKETLQSLPITGVSTTAEGGKRVMLGGFKLERGSIVPQVLPGQTVKLRVNSVSDTTLEMVWVEKKNTGLPPRMLIIPFNIKPSIRVQLVGSATTAGAPASGKQQANYGVIQASSPEMSNTLTTPPTTASSQNSPSSGSLPQIQVPQPPNPNDANHPANMLMNLLLSKPQPTQQPAPAP
jgi:hypothetical protein